MAYTRLLITWPGPYVRSTSIELRTQVFRYVTCVLKQLGLHMLFDSMVMREPSSQALLSFYMNSLSCSIKYNLELKTETQNVFSGLFLFFQLLNMDTLMIWQLEIRIIIYMFTSACLWQFSATYRQCQERGEWGWGGGGGVSLTFREIYKIFSKQIVLQ